MTLLILGGGAAGMLAALSAAENPNCRIILLERQARVGRKLLATGNGRCNLTNVTAAPRYYHGAEPDFCTPALEALSPAATLALFERLGLVTVTEASGRVYPFSDQAASVLDVLRLALERPNIEVRTGWEVTRIWKKQGGYLLKTSQGDVSGDRLIVAAGGPAGEKLGGSDWGVRLLKGLGHTATPLLPSLVQLRCADAVLPSLKGIRADASIRLLDGKQILAESGGEVQFTEFGVSGPAVFEVSRAAAQNGGCAVELDLLRSTSAAELITLLRRKQNNMPGQTAEHLLTGILHNRLGRMIALSAGLRLETPLSRLSSDDLNWVASAVKGFTLQCTGTLGFDCAQVTAGGISTEEFDPVTLQSRLLPGLFACGEVLDIDGDCGGYNLQWAWSSGFVAGRAAAQEENL